MIIIEQSIGNLIKNIPKGTLTKLNLSLSSGVGMSEDNLLEFTVIYTDKVSAIRLVESLNGQFEDLGYNYAIISINSSNLPELARSPSIQYIEFPKSIYFDYAPSNRASCIDRARNTYSIQGEGVIIGFIDSGIDYTHPAFISEDGTTRIKYIYDMSINPKKVYTMDNIDEAIKSQDPYSIVPVYDNTGHGTHVAGIAAAGGDINREYYGVAPKASIIMVKSGRGYYSLSTNIMRGLKFLVDKAKELNMPLVVNMSLSTNDGAHDGRSLLEQYVSTISGINRVTIVVAAGNEGDAKHHIGGELKANTTIKFNVDEGEYNVVMNLYKSILPKVSINLITPSGKATGDIVVQEGFDEGVISGNKYQIYNSGPKPFDITGEIGISLNNDGNEVISGLWTIQIKVINEYEGVYDIWLPISEGLNKGTKFLDATVSNTLGIPATVGNVISVGSYDYKTRTISPFSGRGEFNLRGNIKPDIVAPGEGIIAPIPGGSFDRKVGTSMATPCVSGAAALLMCFGIVRGNDPYLYGERLKHYLIVGSKRERRDITYPSNAWGYGELCLYDSIVQIIDVLGINVLRNDERALIDVNKFESYNQYVDSIIDSSSEVVSILFEYSSKEQIDRLRQIPGISVLIISNSYGIVYLPINMINTVKDIVKKFILEAVESLYTVAEITPLEASDASLLQNGELLSLNGTGTLIGIIDTGIDYLSEEFQKEDGTTRIMSIWDQTLPNDKPVMGLNIGKEFTAVDINKAIDLKKSGGDPYTIVNSKDDIGHGTMVASVACARGINPEVKGVVSDSTISVVKLKPEGEDSLKLLGVTKPNVTAYSATSIISAMVYLQKVALQANMPMVIILPLETNGGPHDGSSAICGLINDFTRKRGIFVVTGVGNEGNTDTHIEGFIEKAGSIATIELKVDPYQDTLAFFIWIKKPSIMSISIISPTGESVDKIPLKVEKEQSIKFVFEKTLMSVRYHLSNEQNGNESIAIRAIGLKSGIWKFKLYGEYVVEGEYASWLPQSKILYDNTRFIMSSQNTTICDNATAARAISVAYYNQNNNSIVGSSGRGFTWDDRIKPDIAAGGINAPVVKPGGIVGVASGSSVATSIVAGVCSMILEWAIVNGNDPDIYEESVRSYLIRGANRRTGDEYPNEEWGYGTINVNNIFEIIRGNYRKQDFTEYYIGALFVRVPLNSRISVNKIL